MQVILSLVSNQIFPAVQAVLQWKGRKGALRMSYNDFLFRDATRFYKFFCGKKE